MNYERGKKNDRLFGLLKFFSWRGKDEFGINLGGGGDKRSAWGEEKKIIRLMFSRRLATRVGVGKSLFEKTTFHMVIDLRRKKTNK